MTGKLYKRFSPDEDFSQLDHIIIGSGIGGFTAATWLAKAGKKVAIFERHYVPGGLTHSFKRTDGFQWDVGVHYVGNVGEGGSLRELFDFLTDHKVEWEPMGDVYDVSYINGQIYDFRAGKEEFRKQLKIYFPDECAAIDNYLSLLDKSNKRGSAFFFEKTFKPILSKTLGWFLRKRYDRYSQCTTLEVLNELTKNKRLIAVLCSQCGNYGLSPKYSSFAAHALVIGHFMEGGYYPKGGSDQICKRALEIIKNKGGHLYINADVQKILVENNRVTGIQVQGHVIPCKSVISNVGVSNTFNDLLSSKDREHCGFDLKNVEPATGHLCLYVGLDKSDAELNLPKHNIWSFASENQDDIIDETQLTNAAENFSYISFPSAKDPEWQTKNPGTATIQALTLGRYEWFEKYEKAPWMKRGSEYEEIKTNFEESMLNKLYSLFPQIKGHVKVTEVSTPLSTKHFTNYKHGEIYGLAHTPARFALPFLRPETRIKGLRLVGQDITLVGVAGAMLSGMLCAITILKFGVWKLFKEMKEKK